MPVLMFDHLHGEKKSSLIPNQNFPHLNLHPEEANWKRELHTAIAGDTSAARSIGTAPVGFVLRRGVSEGSCRIAPASLPLLPQGSRPFLLIVASCCVVCAGRLQSANTFQLV